MVENLSSKCKMEGIGALLIGALPPCNTWFHCDQVGQYTAWVEQSAGAHWLINPRRGENGV